MLRQLAALALTILALALLLAVKIHVDGGAAETTASPRLPVVKLAALELLQQGDFIMADLRAVYLTTAAPAAAGVFKSASAANVQVWGVDEEDYVKFDGEYLYVAAGWRLYVVDKTPRVVKTLECPGLGCHVFVWGGRALVYGETRGYTVLYVYDLGSGSRLAVFNLSGWPAAARMSDGAVYIVAQSPAKVEINGRVVEEAPVLALGAPPAVLVIAGVDLRSLQFNASVYVAGSTPRVYMRGNRLYVITPLALPDYLAKAVNATWGHLPDDVKKRLDRTNPLLLYLSIMELLKNGTDVVHILNRANITTATRIYVFEGEGPHLRLKAVAEAPGKVLDQFAVEEFDGGFAVATTASPIRFHVGYVWRAVGCPVIDITRTPARVVVRCPPEPRLYITEGEPVNAVYVFDKGGRLVGSVEGLAPGERIYAARLVGNVMYLITFRQVDPLYAVDLADPARPRVLGYLKTPGFSEYLHPVGEGLLLGVGLHGRGVKIALFDVSNPAAPREMSNITIAGAYPPVFQDHHAFAYDPSTRLAFIPYVGHYGRLRTLFIEVGRGLAVKADLDLPAERAFFTEDGVYLVGWRMVWRLNYRFEKIGEAVLG
ncbi:beta-propeller domain-containing protein [Pyrobaculum sp. 3827-6]|uniref:beta-propeller domain-containing protein n=1 Tax=Pyrobaculum sp. 3827-6 TaxID=2983604 RepID=UPI0021D898FE|nr:beta-propeller domain-containing protein [Pyrobaculum sp. 3827-6]MCU7787742.1 beta-propeller domain-containing protein [Pyrobaculum sp. 3827-6]